MQTQGFLKTAKRHFYYLLWEHVRNLVFITKNYLSKINFLRFVNRIMVMPLTFKQFGAGGMCHWSCVRQDGTEQEALWGDLAATPRTETYGGGQEIHMDALQKSPQGM